MIEKAFLTVLIVGVLATITSIAELPVDIFGRLDEMLTLARGGQWIP